MSGHSHFATIKRQKEAKDAAKGNLFSKLARSVMIAAKSGPDPDMNYKLRFEVDKAKSLGMPKENIERAIAKATTEAANLEEITYEGFGPGGIGIVIQAATDNKNRTAQEIKNTLERGGGSLGGPGAVSFNFENKGFMLIKKNDDSESQVLALIDAGVEDINDTNDGIEVYLSPAGLGVTQKKLSEAGFEILQTELQMKPKNFVTLENESNAQKALTLLSNLEELDDVQKVFSNLDIPEKIMTNIHV